MVSGLLELLRSFLQALLRTSAFTSSFPCLEVLVQSASPHHAVGCKVLPVLGVDVKYFHVSLAEILVAQLRAAFGSPSRCQLSIQNVFWDAAILHAVDMPQPMQPALTEQGEHAWKVGSGQDLAIGHSVLPRYAKDTAGKVRYTLLSHKEKFMNETLESDALPHWDVSLLFVCITSHQHTSVYQGRVCSDNCTCCHTETERQIKLSTSPSHSIQTPGQPVY